MKKVCIISTLLWCLALSCQVSYASMALPAWFNAVKEKEPRIVDICRRQFVDYPQHRYHDTTRGKEDEKHRQRLNFNRGEEERQYLHSTLQKAYKQQPPDWDIVAGVLNCLRAPDINRDVTSIATEILTSVKTFPDEIMYVVEGSIRVLCINPDDAQLNLVMSHLEPDILGLIDDYKRHGGERRYSLHYRMLGGIASSLLTNEEKLDLFRGLEKKYEFARPVVKPEKSKPKRKPVWYTPPPPTESSHKRHYRSIYCFAKDQVEYLEAYDPDKVIPATIPPNRPLTVPKPKKPTVHLTVGYMGGGTESEFIADMLRNIFDALPHIDGDYIIFGRQPVQKPEEEKSLCELADIAVVFVGPTKYMGEISGLVKQGDIQPLDDLPDFSNMINPLDIYPNLLAPGYLQDKLWAVPVRVCPPALFVRNLPEYAPDEWMQILKYGCTEGFYYRTTSDLYLLWRSVLMSEGYHLFIDQGYRAISDNDKRYFKILCQLVESNDGRNSKTKNLGIAEGNLFVRYPIKSSIFTLFEYPGDKNAPVYCNDAAYFAVVSSRVTDEKRAAVSEFLSTLLKSKFQVRLSRFAKSPPVRPSIINSESFQEYMASNQSISVFTAMSQRLTFRPAKYAEAEQIIEDAFCSSFSNPDDFETVMNEAIERANSILN